MRSELCIAHLVNEEAVQSALRASSDAEVLVYLADTFQTLANPTRLLIVEALSKRELCVCDLAAVAGASQSAVSHHLKLLRHMWIVSHRREGRMVYYRLTDEHIAQILDIGLVHVREEWLIRPDRCVRCGWINESVSNQDPQAPPTN